MKYFYNILFCSLMVGLCTQAVHAARLSIDVPEEVPVSGGPITVSVTIDPQGEIVGALSGRLSFSSEFFDVSDIVIRDSVVSMWLVPPAAVKDERLGRTSISFEGVIPGGFSGVHNPFHKDERVGNIASITLIPKKKGMAQFILDSVEVRRSDSEGSLLSDKSFSASLTILQLPQTPDLAKLAPAEISGDGLAVTFAQSELVENGAWYVVFDDASHARAIDHFEIAESNSSDPHDVDTALWKRASSPHVLNGQSRNMYLHVKAAYADGSFAYATLPPVENPDKGIILLCILSIISVVVALFHRFKAHPPHALLLFRKRK